MNLVLQEKQTQLLEQVKHTVLALEPGAEIILYGSRARGDAQPDSDWDFLILVDGKVSEKRQQSIRRHLYDIELASDEIISTIIRDRREYDQPLFRAMPFYQNVRREGIQI